MGNMPKPFLLSEEDNRRFISMLKKSIGCWNWSGYKLKNGYGGFRSSGRYLKAHRVSFQIFIKELDCTKVIDHKCRNRLCVNPNHLEEVDETTNILRGESPTAKNSIKTHCPRGHDYNEENTILKRGTNRDCRKCQKIHKAKFMRKKYGY